MSSSDKPVRIALTMRETQASGYVEPRDAIAQDWFRWFRALPFSISPVLIPNDPELAVRLLNDFQPSAIVLTGGNDIGESDARDSTERTLLKHYPLVPTLGVCRGMQLLADDTQWSCNPAANQDHCATRHCLEWTVPAHALFAASAPPVPTEVNSYHNLLLPAEDAPHQWIVAARHADSSAEMILHRELPRIGIMWHPEREDAPNDFDLFLFNHLRQLSL